MNSYRRMAIFVSVVKHGSLRKAAAALGLTPSAVSQQIRRLEEETGVVLLRRSTRQMTLTDAGRVFHEGCVGMVSAADRARERLVALQDSPVGELAISAPGGFAAGHLMDALAPLLEAHPRLTVRIVVSDDPVDIIRERIDLAIAISRPLRDSSLVRRRLAEWSIVLCAAPAYLARRGTPRTPAALSSHDFLALPSGHHPLDVLAGPRGRKHRVTVRPRVTSNNQFAVRQLALRGAGLSFQAEPEIAADLEAGRLVRVLPRWRGPSLNVDALMPTRSPQPAKVRLAIEALRAHLGSTSGTL